MVLKMCKCCVKRSKRFRTRIEVVKKEIEEREFLHRIEKKRVLSKTLRNQKIQKT